MSGFFVLKKLEDTTKVADTTNEKGSLSIIDKNATVIQFKEKYPIQ